MENILLSYPRSGNHLVRFFIELLSETPTYGCKGNNKDKEIYRNVFEEIIPFNITNFDKRKCYFKYHFPPSKDVILNKLILIVRNPKEVLLRHNCYRINIKSFEGYFKNIDFYNNYKGKKILLYYEDILQKKKKFIETLYEFLDLKNLEKKKYVLANLDKLYKLSAKGKNRVWGGIISNSINYYYEKIQNPFFKKIFDEYLNDKFEKYPFLKEKYN